MAGYPPVVIRHPLTTERPTPPMWGVLRIVALIALIYVSLVGTGDRIVPLPANERVYVGLDVATAKVASYLMSRLASTGCGFKIGPHFVLDPEFSQLINGLCGIDNGRFIDHKHLDIPETISFAIAAAASRRFNYSTIHARHKSMMQAAVNAAQDSILNVLAVPLLTSEPESFKSRVVRERIDWSIETGCQGIICSPQDVAFAKTIIPSHFLVGAPGIMMDDTDRRDHLRAGTPEQAIGDGADFIVIARYVVNADDPVGALCRVIDRIKRI